MRKRMIDPGYWSDDKVIELEPTQRLLFIGMWNFADDSGVLKNSSKQLKAQIFPADNIDDDTFKQWLNNLYKLGLILLNMDKSLIKIKGWSNYQKINRPQPSKYIFTEENHESFTEQSLNGHGVITPNRREENRIEVNRKEKKVQTDERFEQFYSLYPKKQSKQETKRAIKKLTKKDFILVMEALPKHIDWWANKGTDMDFIPLPSTWLNKRKYEDVLDIGTITNKVDKDKEEAEAKDKREYYANLKKNSASTKDIKEILGEATKKLTVGNSGRS